MGFPTRTSRAAIGVDKLNSLATISPKLCVPAEEYMRLAWLAAGAGLCVPLAWVLVSAAGARVASAESWNPNGDSLLVPTTSRTSSGLFVVTYAATYPNELGYAAPLVLNAGEAAPQGATANLVGVPSFAGNTVTVRISAGATAALTDAAFLLKVY